MKKEYHIYGDYIEIANRYRDYGMDISYLAKDIFGFSDEEIRRFSNEGRWGELDHPNYTTHSVTGASGPTESPKETINWNYLLIG